MVRQSGVGTWAGGEDGRQNQYWGQVGVSISGGVQGDWAGHVVEASRVWPGEFVKGQCGEGPD